MFSNINTKSQCKNINDYMNDYPTFLLSDFKTIKESIINNKQYVQKINFSDTKKQNTSKSDSKKTLSSNWSDIPNIVFGIKDNEQLFNTLASYKKQKVGIGYIYIESTQYISIIIKKPQKYPLVIVRIPVEVPFVYINNDYIGLLFNFPIEEIYGKEAQTKSKNKQYRLYLSKHDNSFVMTLESIVNNDIRTTEVANINRYVNNTSIDITLRPSMTKYINSFTLNNINDISCAINEMNIIIINKLPPNNKSTPISFCGLQNKQAAYLDIIDDRLDYIIRGDNKNDKQTVLLKENSIYWPQINYNNVSYVIHDYDQLFKQSHYDIKTTKNNIYYILSTFLNAHMFIILISDQDVSINDKDKIYTYQDIFNKGTQIMEMYLLIKVK